MHVATVGLWHLGSVIAACLAEAGFDVVGVDPDLDLVAQLERGEPAVDEPGLAELIAACRDAGTLRFAAPSAGVLGDASVVWIAFDTPIGDDDVADPDWVLERSSLLLADAAPDALVICSSQLPVGSTATLEQRLAAAGRGDLRFAVIPENLRVGRALDTFRAPDRFVVGVRNDRDREQLQSLLEPFAAPIEWMGVESAEMTKHALNGFLATSIAWINEVAALCETVGADADEVSRGLRSDRRVGAAAYLNPGGAYGGGTLGRDIGFLAALAERHALPAKLLSGVAASNSAHREWPQRTLAALLGELAGRRVAVWGLTYKPGTNTLRRSDALVLCHWLANQEATVRAHDPAVSELPDASIELCPTPLEAVSAADALVVCTPWPDYRAVDAGAVIAAMSEPVVIDAGGFLSDTLGANAAVRYSRVGVRSS